MDVSIRELKGKLSKYIREAQKGNTIRVTSRGTPVALLIPLQTSVSSSERMKDIPWVDASSGDKPKGVGEPVRMGRKQTTLSDIVIEGRR